MFILWQQPVRRSQTAAETVWYRLYQPRRASQIRPIMTQLNPVWTIKPLPEDILVGVVVYSNYPTNHNVALYGQVINFRSSMFSCANFSNQHRARIPFHCQVAIQFNDHLFCNHTHAIFSAMFFTITQQGHGLPDTITSASGFRLITIPQHRSLGSSLKVARIIRNGWRHTRSSTRNQPRLPGSSCLRHSQGTMISRPRHTIPSQPVSSLLVCGCCLNRGMAIYRWGGMCLAVHPLPPHHHRRPHRAPHWAPHWAPHLRRLYSAWSPRTWIVALESHYSCSQHPVALVNSITAMYMPITPALIERHPPTAWTMVSDANQPGYIKNWFVDCILAV